MTAFAGSEDFLNLPSVFKISLCSSIRIWRGCQGSTSISSSTMDFLNISRWTSHMSIIESGDIPSLTNSCSIMDISTGVSSFTIFANCSFTGSRFFFGSSWSFFIRSFKTSFSLLILFIVFLLSCLHVYDIVF